MYAFNSPRGEHRPYSSVAVPTPLSSVTGLLVTRGSDTMKKDEKPGPPTGNSRRARSQQEATVRLHTALAEQARLGDAFALATGTSAEQSSHMRLAAASLRVSVCDRALKRFERDDE